MSDLVERLKASCTHLVDGISACPAHQVHNRCLTCQAADVIERYAIQLGEIRKAWREYTLANTFERGAAEANLGQAIHTNKGEWHGPDVENHSPLCGIHSVVPIGCTCKGQYGPDSEKRCRNCGKPVNYVNTAATKGLEPICLDCFYASDSQKLNPES